ncbi:unnamed protein product [Rotaria sp. Silwood2]|nr:unnamed protein product [Rotaria sp. Silwood2]
MAARIYKFLDHNSYSSCTLIRTVESKYFTIIMLSIIGSNTIVMILETYDSYYQKYHSFFLLLEKIYLCIYIIEFCFKLWVVDSFQQTLDYDTKKDKQLKNENNIEKRILNNLTQLTEEYCDDRKFNKETDDVLMDEKVEQKNVANNLTKDYRQKQNLLYIENIMKEYYMLMESLEFRMERHEQLTKLAQKSIKLTLIDQENRKTTMKK